MREPTFDEQVSAHMEQVGWVKWDGDEYHDFRYWKPGDRRTDRTIRAEGYVPVYCAELNGTPLGYDDSKEEK